MRRRIAFIGIKGLPSMAGADRVVEAIVNRLDKSKYDITVYGSARTIAKGTCLDGLRLVRIPALTGKHLRPTSLYLLSALHALFLGNYDLVHVHNIEACFILPVLRIRFKVLSTSHAASYRMQKWGKIARALMRFTEIPFVALSNDLTAVSAGLASEYGHRYKKDVHHIPNGADPEIKVAEGGKKRTVFGTFIPDVRDYILFAAARVIPEKGCHILLDAWARIESDLELWIVGDLSHIPAYGKGLKLQADPRVHFFPLISSKEELFEIFRGCRLFVFASEDESMSMTVLEVASLGVPLVCSDIPSNTGILPERALFFRTGDTGDLEDKLKWALDHPREMEDMAAEARSWVTANFNWNKIVPRYEALYESVCPAWYSGGVSVEQGPPGGRV